jgi:hypothetical protein
VAGAGNEAVAIGFDAVDCTGEVVKTVPGV